MSRIFVFGSNLAGIHGAGSAAAAMNKHGAVWGVGVGRTGNAYAIPTKAANVWTILSLEEIKKHVDDFIQYANEHPELHFDIVAVGCGLAGYTMEQIAPLFINAPDNCNFLDSAFMQLVKSNYMISYKSGKQFIE